MLGSRKAGPQVWDVIMWELSTTLYTMATLYQDNPPAVTDKVSFNYLVSIKSSLVQLALQNYSFPVPKNLKQEGAITRTFYMAH